MAKMLLYEGAAHQLFCYMLSMIYYIVLCFIPLLYFIYGENTTFTLSICLPVPKHIYMYVLIGLQIVDSFCVFG